jgi:membrane protease YdiL (CAAX protease family)
VVFGCLVGLLAWALINASYFSKTLDFFVQIIGPWRLSWLEIVVVSCCAGVGEEILFRGAIQPHLGIIWTSILFVVLHGYINPFNGAMTAYGIFMVLAICLLGWAALQFGLVLAIVAHTVIDIILLYCLSRAYMSDTKNIPID